MPRPGVNWDDPAFWDQMYASSAEPWGHPPSRPGVRLHYHRAVVLPVYRELAGRIVTALGWTSQSRVFCVGCGFGWMMEALEELGISQTVGADLSAYIQGRKNLSEDDEIKTHIAAAGLDPLSGDGLTLLTTLRGEGVRAKKASLVTSNDIGTDAGRDAIRTFLNGPGFDVFTEDVLTSLTDAECVQLSKFAHRGNFGADRVIHLVTPLIPEARQNPVFNWKTLAEWKALLPADLFVSITTIEVL